MAYNVNCIIYKVNISKGVFTMDTTRQTNSKSSLFSPLRLALTGLMTAVLCILGPLSIPLPVSPVPISFTNLAVLISVYVLGMKYGTVSCLLYLLLGFIGLPVFSGFSGGPAKLAGPTGGYLIGFLFLALIAGVFLDRFPKNYLLHVAGMILGMAVCYLFGTLWLCLQMQLDLWGGLMAGVIPYLPGDAVKIAAAILVGPVLKKAVRRAAPVS